MRIFFLGTDGGNAMIMAMILVIVLSTLYIAFTTRLSAAEKFAREYKAWVVSTINESNREVLDTYDLR